MFCFHDFAVFIFLFDWKFCFLWFFLGGSCVAFSWKMRLLVACSFLLWGEKCTLIRSCLWEVLSWSEVIWDFLELIIWRFSFLMVPDFIKFGTIGAIGLGIRNHIGQLSYRRVTSETGSFWQCLLVGTDRIVLLYQCLDLNWSALRNFPNVIRRVFLSKPLVSILYFSQKI